MDLVARDYVIQPFRPPVDFQIDYAAELNPQQHQAVTAPPGPSLVIAGAGSGKTRTLVYRVAYLLEQGIPADRILLLTFTNKAAKEMMRRISDLLGHELRTLVGGTFHSIGARLLRQNADRLGWGKDFTILDREDTRDLIKACLGSEEGIDQNKAFPKPDALLDMFSMAVNKYSSLAEAIAMDYPQFGGMSGGIEALAKRFTERKRSANVMDFDDLLSGWLSLLKEHPDVLDRYQRQYQFILVDEYQDTNSVQGSVIDLLGARHKNVMVVGDDSQSIYSWRGANFLNILDFPKRYPGAVVYKIETNYRSTPEILSLANAAIAPNLKQFTKQLNPSRPSGTKPAVVESDDGGVQASFVAQRIIELHEEGVALPEIAVLYRSHFHVMELQLELTRRGVPFLITSGIRFFEQAHIKDVSAFLRFMANPLDEIAFKRIAQLMRGIGPKAAEKIWDQFLTKFQLIMGGADSKPLHPIATAIQTSGATIPKKSQIPWTNLITTLAQLEGLKSRPSEMIQVVLEAFYEDYMEENFDNYRNRQEDVEQLSVFAHNYTELDEFLTQLSLLSSTEMEDKEAKKDDTEKIRLTTIHQAKGLEYDVVFVIMLCEGLFPSSRSMESSDGLEEERRLFYVAVTRARNELYLCYPTRRFTHAYGETHQAASRFLMDLPTDLFEEWRLKED